VELFHFRRQRSLMQCEPELAGKGLAGLVRIKKTGLFRTGFYQ
jgi:hypothetical protein